MNDDKMIDKIKDNELEIISDLNLEYRLVNYLIENKLTISAAESCTGGMIMSTLINVPGASKVINEGYITYSTESKMRILGVVKSTVDEYSVYSKEVALQMALGILKNSKADIVVSVTGLTDSSGGVFDYCIIYNNRPYLYNYTVYGERNEIRSKQTRIILWTILEILGVKNDI
jgi:PncC family amidohydrolase